MRCDFSNSAVSQECDSFRKFKGVQALEDSIHFTSRDHTIVVFLRLF